MNRILNISNSLASPNQIEPIHLFLGSCLEGTGVCGELYLYLARILGPDFISKISNSIKPNHNEGFHLIDNHKLSNVAKQIIDQAHEKMSHFNQIYINEGHLFSSLLNTIDFPFISDELKINILNITSSPRDLTVLLEGFTFEDFGNVTEVEIRRVTHDDNHDLIHFVRSEFGERWIEAVNCGFSYEKEIPIFIAIINGQIIGFACFDVVRNKKGLFGPMGTSKKCRKNGIGKMLLHYSLESMKLLGYEYAIIGQAGPIEFYEKNSNAMLIPVKE
jgi:predicted N-acetyltransferase YhbS